MLRRRRERRRRVTLRWFVLIGCIVIAVFAALIWTDSCEGSRSGDARQRQVAAAGQAAVAGQVVAAEQVVTR
jgi:hypothetical protein